MKRVVLVLAGLNATPAFAQERDYCPERPGINTPACIVDKGHVSVETGLADWTLDRRSDARTDTVLVGDTLVRVGVAHTVEARIGWTPFGHERTRDRVTGQVETHDQVGDISLGLKASLLHPDGSDLSIAALPFVTLPVGGSHIGAGAVTAGFLLPVSYDLFDVVQFAATPEIDAQADEDGHGRHLQYSAASGFTFKLGKAVSLQAEAQVIQDNDPDDRTTQALASLSVAWQPRGDWQFDVQGLAGLNRDTPDIELAAGISRRF